MKNFEIRKLCLFLFLSIKNQLFIILPTHIFRNIEYLCLIVYIVVCYIIIIFFFILKYISSLSINIHFLIIIIPKHFNFIQYAFLRKIFKSGLIPSKAECGQFFCTTTCNHIQNSKEKIQFSRLSRYGIHCLFVAE